jgi:hypothetical protein
MAMIVSVDWVVTYGCAEWQSEERGNQAAMRERFDAALEECPCMGLYSADYLMLRDPTGNAVDSHSWQW